MLSFEQHCFAATSPGLEGVLEEEARALGKVKRVVGGVELTGPPGVHEEACLRLRTANRVLLRLAELPRSPWTAVATALAQLDLAALAPEGAPLSLEFTLRQASAPSAPALCRWLHRVWRRPVHAVGGEGGAAQGTRLLLRVAEGPATLSADASGELLYRRGWRQEVGRAPLRETLAAGLLALAGWRPEESLWDPLCGSGTLLVEAALKARRMAPGLGRSFAFESWPGTDLAAWQRRRAKAANESRSSTPAPLMGSDINAGALGTARRNARRAAVLDSLQLARADIATLTPGATQPGLLLANLPYGRRLRGPKGQQALFQAVGETVRTRFSAWRSAFLTAQPERLECAVGVPPSGTYPLNNGGLAVTLLCFSAKGQG